MIPEENYPSFPLRTITDKEAAELYLKHWRINEGPYSENPDQAKIDMKELSDKLDKGGYPLPDDVIYDNEAEPLIYWTNRDFNFDEWYEENAESWDAAGD